MAQNQKGVPSPKDTPTITPQKGQHSAPSYNPGPLAVKRLIEGQDVANIADLPGQWRTWAAGVWR